MNYQEYNYSLNQQLESNWWTNVFIIFILAKLLMLYAYSTVNNGGGFIHSVMRADSWWFDNIIHNGYMMQVLTNDPIRMNQANWAFFPLYPMLCKLMIGITGLNAAIVEVAVNQTELLICLFLTYKMALKNMSPNSAIFLPLVIAFSPANIWFLAAYSDMTYLLFTVLVFQAYRVKRYWLAALLGYFLTLSRFVGIVIIVSHLISYWQYKQFNLRNSIELVLQLIIISSGLLTFMVYLHFKCGDALAFYHIQAAWGHLSTDWLHTPLKSFMDTWHSGVEHDRFFLAIAPFFLVILLLHKRFAEFAFAFLCLLAPILAGSLWSYSRYVLGIYPIYLSISLLHRRYPLLALGVLLLFVFISAGYYNDWFNDRWV